MGYVLGVFLVVVGSLLAVSNAYYAERVGAANNAFFKRESFTGKGWTRWNRGIAVLVGGFFAVAGLLLLVGVLDLRR